MAPLESKKQSEISGEIKISHTPKTGEKPSVSKPAPIAKDAKNELVTMRSTVPSSDAGQTLPHASESELAMKHERILEPSADLLAKPDQPSQPAHVVVPGGAPGALPDPSKLFHSRYRPSGSSAGMPTMNYQQSYSQNTLHGVKMPELGYVPADRGLHNPERSRKFLIIGFAALIAIVIIGYVAATFISNGSSSDNFSEIQEVTEEIQPDTSQTESQPETLPDGSNATPPTPSPTDGEAIY